VLCPGSPRSPQISGQLRRRLAVGYVVHIFFGRRDVAVPEHPLHSWILNLRIACMPKVWRSSWKQSRGRPARLHALTKRRERSASTISSSGRERRWKTSSSSSLP
jgi:hypothetical protein